MLKEPKEFQHLTLPNSTFWGELSGLRHEDALNKIIDEIRLLHMAYIEAWHALQEKESGAKGVGGPFEKVIRQVENMAKGKPMGN